MRQFLQGKVNFHVRKNQVIILRKVSASIQLVAHFTLLVLFLFCQISSQNKQISCTLVEHQNHHSRRARQIFGETTTIGDDDTHGKTFEQLPRLQPPPPPPFASRHAQRHNKHGHLRSRAVYMAYDHSRINSSESLSSSWFYQQDQPAILDKCCACDEAKYELVFEGLWSKYTHPDDFPENYWLAYFSDIIGASHSNDFRMWAQDALASDGVKELAETGVTKKLESELKQVSLKTRTIIKARELRYPTLNSKTSAVFRTDKHHHLVSILSKLGPSPDWMVGVSSLELCQVDCTWTAQRVVNLYLWDAGTDSGTTFTSSDIPTRPQERIHLYKRADGSQVSSSSTRLLEQQQQQQSQSGSAGGGNSYGNMQYVRNQRVDQQAIGDQTMLLPIVDDTTSGSSYQNTLTSSTGQRDQMKPFARLTVTRQRIYEKSCNANTMGGGGGGSSEPALSNSRTYNQHHPLPTISSESFIEPTRASYSDCRFTDWSDWSSCSSTCGKGIRTRTRSFYDDQAHSATGCSQSDLIEKEICLAECIGNTSCMTHDWSEWSNCSVECGQGYRKRTRSPIGPMRLACGSIELAEMEQCVGSCAQDPIENYNISDQQQSSASTTSLHCSVTDWSQWSECSVACGKGTKIRTRQFVRKGDLESCAPHVKLLQKQSCNGRPELCKQVAQKRIQNRDRVCMLPAESGMCRAYMPRWHYDKTTDKCKRFNYGGCAGNENNFHTLQDCRRAYNSGHNGQQQAHYHHHHHQQQQPQLQLQNQKQINFDLPVIDCKLSNWSPWSTCSALCGNGKKTRSRYIIQMPQNGGKPCDKRLTRTQKCKDLPPCPQDFSINSSNGWTASGDGGGGGDTSTGRNIKHFAPLGFYRTTTSTITPRGSMMDDEDDSKFSRLLKADLGHLQLNSWTSTESYISDGTTSSTTMELIGSSSFHIRNGLVYPFGESLKEKNTNLN